MRGLYDVCRMCGVSCSHGTECVTILNRAALAELRACGVSIGASERKIEHLDWFVGGNAGKIRRLQAALNETGMVERLTEDGVYGEKTEDAEEHFVQILINNLEEVLKNKAAVRCINIYLSTRLYIAGKTGGGIAYKIKEVLYNNKKTIQRLIWKLGAEYYLRPRGYNVAALLLEHSLKSAPSDLYCSQMHWVPRKIMNSKGFKDAFSELEKKIKEDPDVYAVPGKLEMNFQKSGDTDLYYGIGKCDIKYTCIKQHSSVWVKFSTDDPYNFDEIRSISANIESGIQVHFADLGNLANDAGLLSQADGVISTFSTHIQFAKIVRIGGTSS